MRRTAEEEYQARRVQAVESAKKLLAMVAWRTSSKIQIMSDPVFPYGISQEIVCYVQIDDYDKRIMFKHTALEENAADFRVKIAAEMLDFDNAIAELRGGKRLVRMQLINPTEQGQDPQSYEHQVTALRYYKEERQRVENLLDKNLSEYVGRLVFSDAPEHLRSKEVAAEYQPIKDVEFKHRYGRLAALVLAEIIGSILDVSNPPYDNLFHQHPIKTALSQLYLSETKVIAFILLGDCCPLDEESKDLLHRELYCSL